MIVSYSQYSVFLVNSYKPVYVSSFDRDLTFTFSNYVKSQLHLNMVGDLYGRDIFEYNKALAFLRGNKRYGPECSAVLRYFYQDVTNMLVTVVKNRPSFDKDIEIVVDIEGDLIPKKFVRLDKVREMLTKILEEGGEDPFEMADGILSKFTFKEIDNLKPSNILALAAIYLYYGSTTMGTYAVEVIE